MKMLSRNIFGAVTQFAAAAMFTAIAATASVSASTITVDGGSQFSGDCTFACVVRYQQVYDGSIFSGPVTISSVSFIVTGEDNPWSAGNSWQMSLSTSANPVNALSTTFASNLGTDNAVFDTKSFAGTPIAGSFITFNGSFVFDPVFGDLLVDVLALGNVGGPLVLYNSLAGSTFSRAYDFCSTVTTTLCGAAGANQYGNVTVFGIGEEQVPEPSVLALIGIALLSVFGFRMMRRSACA